MKIEELTQSNIKKVDDRELYSLRLRFLQVWKKHFGNPIKKSEEIDRGKILENYQTLKKEMESRKLSHDVKEIDKILFQKTIYNIDVPSLDEQVISEDFISIAGDFVKNPKSVEKVDVVIKGNEGHSEELEAFVENIVTNIMMKDSNVMYMVEGPTDKHIPLFDIVLRPKTVTKVVDIRKPETTEKYHRIPVNKTCKITATIDISEKKGIKALYCGKEKEIATYLFDVKKWTMAKAKEWVKEQKVKKAEEFECECVDCGYKMKTVVHCVNIKCPECGGQMRRASRPGSGKPEEQLNKSIKIFKISKDKQIIGVVVYAPDEVDTQGDKATAEEIEKAAHKFNLGSRAFKIMHKGKEIDVDLLETYIMPANVIIGKEKITKGSWFVVCKVNDKDAWKGIKSGEISGISMGGEADRVLSLS